MFLSVYLLAAVREVNKTDGEMIFSNFLIYFLLKTTQMGSHTQWVIRTCVQLRRVRPLKYCWSERKVSVLISIQMEIIFVRLS